MATVTETVTFLSTVHITQPHLMQMKKYTRGKTEPKTTLEQTHTQMELIVKYKT